MSLIRAGAMTSAEVLTSNLEFFTMFTKLDITSTGDYSDLTQKDFEAVVQVIGLRAMPVLMNVPIEIDGITDNLEDFGAQTLTGSGWIFKFAFERAGAHTVASLNEELHGIVLNGGVIRTSGSVNTEFTRQDLL